MTQIIAAIKLSVVCAPHCRDSLPFPCPRRRWGPRPRFWRRIVTSKCYTVEKRPQPVIQVFLCVWFPSFWYNCYLFIFSEIPELMWCDIQKIHFGCKVNEKEEDIGRYIFTYCSTIGFKGIDQWEKRWVINGSIRYIIGLPLGYSRWDFQPYRYRPHPLRGLKQFSEPWFCHLKSILVCK